MPVAALAVAAYALVAAWFVLADGTGPAPLQLDWTADRGGVIVSGAVSDQEAQAALLDAIAQTTNAPVIVSELVVDPDAAPLSNATDTARALADDLEPGD